MPQKVIYLKNIGEVVVTSRKGSRSLRISLKPDGRVVLNIPRGVSQKLAEDFINAKIDWIKKHRINQTLLVGNQQVGKSHRLIFTTGTGNRPSARIKQNQIVVTSGGQHYSSLTVQKIAKNAAKKALMAEANHLLPHRIKFLASQNNIQYKSLQIKHHKTRWGVCDSQKNIILNCFLMQLPWHIIDYVIIHELSHTVHMSHSKSFWDFVENIIPNTKNLRKELKQYRPSF